MDVADLNTQLDQAVREKDLGKMRRFIADGAEIDHPFEGSTLLWFAVFSAQQDRAYYAVAWELLVAGANPDLIRDRAAQLNEETIALINNKIRLLGKNPLPGPQFPDPEWSRREFL
jgi:hypothetical protein